MGRRRREWRCEVVLILPSICSCILFLGVHGRIRIVVKTLTEDGLVSGMRRGSAWRCKCGCSPSLSSSNRSLRSSEGKTEREVVKNILTVDGLVSGKRREKCVECKGVFSPSLSSSNRPLRCSGEKNERDILSECVDVLVSGRRREECVEG